jgi:hypothetical protein
MDTPAPSNGGLSLGTRHNPSTKVHTTQQHSSETTLESASSNADLTSTRAIRHSSTTRSRDVRISHRHDRDESSDFLHADESLLRLLEEGPFSERPLNQPLQVQPPRETAKKDSVVSHRTSTAASANVDNTRESNLEVVNDAPQDEVVDDVSDADEGDYVILGEDDEGDNPKK